VPTFCACADRFNKKFFLVDKIKLKVLAWSFEITLKILPLTRFKDPKVAF
jgi:hypothetical protein